MQQSRVIPSPRSFACDLATLCAPTLAGLKPASLFRYQPAPGQDAAAMAAAWHAALSPRGVTVRVLKQCPRTGAVLVYVYRPARVARLLADDRTCWHFLAGEGYIPGTADELLDATGRKALLRAEISRMRSAFFWATRLADVIGFIQNRGKNFTACGYWKVYTDPTAAQAEFDRYKKCERIYARCYYNGTPIRRLTVAA